MKQMTAFLVLALTACGGGDAGPLPARDRIIVRQSDFAMSVRAAAPQAGPMVFEVINKGPSNHSFVIIKTDLAEDALPVNAEGVVRAKGDGFVTVSLTQPFIKAGTTRPIGQPRIDAGRYVLICRVPGHYGKGMHAAVTIRE